MGRNVKELLPYITTFAGDAVVPAIGNIAVAAITTQERWLITVALSPADNSLGFVLLETLGGVPLFATDIVDQPMGCQFVARRLSQSDNGLQLRRLSGIASDVAWTVVVADAPQGILGGASTGIINNRQDWAGTGTLA
jgi:hypothetical protein